MPNIYTEYNDERVKQLMELCKKEFPHLQEYLIFLMSVDYVALCQPSYREPLPLGRPHGNFEDKEGIKSMFNSGCCFVPHERAKLLTYHHLHSSPASFVL